jgi:hypothetical protein
MMQKIAAALIIVAVIFSAGTAIVLNSSPAAPENNIVCPKDGSLYVWTPIGTRSENFIWRCLKCGYQWTHSYLNEAYENWTKAFLDPAFVRDYVLLYLKTVLELELPDPFSVNWTGGRQTPEGILGYESYVYEAEGVTVSIGYPVVLPENTVYKIRVEKDGSMLWQGELNKRRFVESEEPQQGGNGVKPIYEYYGGVGVFERGIHVAATTQNPIDLMDDYSIVNDFWQFLNDKVTTRASADDFISIIIARGNYSTGGYTIQVQAFSWLESYPVKLRFAVNFTDPGEGVAVTEAFTNPLVLVPLGKLDPGEYVVEVYVTRYIMTSNKDGNPVYTPILTFAAEVWTQTFVIE